MTNMKNNDFTKISKKIESEIESLQKVEFNSRLSEIDSVYSDIVENDTNLNSSIHKIFEHKAKLYENLIGAYIGRTFYNYINKEFDSVNTSEKLLNAFSKEPNSELSTKLNNFLNYLNIRKNLNSESNEFLNEVDVITLRDYGRYFKDFFDTYKKDFNMSHANVSSNINSKNIEIDKNHINSFVSDESDDAKIFVNFYDNEGTPINPKSGSSEINSMNIEIINGKNEIIKENGSEEYPFLIKNSDDFMHYLDKTNSLKYYKLVNNIVVSKNDLEFQFLGNFDGDGYVITFKGEQADTTVVFKGSIKNTNFEFSSQHPSEKHKIKILFTPNVISFHNNNIYTIPKSTVELSTEFKDNNESINWDDTIIKNTLIHTYEKSKILLKDGSLLSLSNVLGKEYLRLTSISNTESQNNKTEYTISGKEVLIYPERKNDFNTIKSGERIILTDVYMTEPGVYKDNENNTTIKVLLSVNKTNISLNISLLKFSEVIDSETILYNITNDEIIGKEFNLSIADNDKIVSLDNIGSQFRVFYAIGALGRLAFIEQQSTKIQNVEDFLNSIIEDINLISSELILNSEILKENYNNNLADTMKAVESFLNIDSLRASNDAMYNDEYILKMKNLFSTILANLTMLNNNIINLDLSVAKETIKKYIELLNIETTSIIESLNSSIIRVNDTLENYKILHSIEKNYNITIINAAKVISEILTNKEFNQNGGIDIRNFNLWCNKISPAIRESLSTLAEIYIHQEIGVNLNNKDKDSNTVFHKSRTILNRTLISAYKKNLLTRSDGTIFKVKEFEYEKDLYNSGILVSENAALENITSRLALFDSRFDIVSNINIENILKYPKSDIILDTKLDKIIELEIIKSIFNSSDSEKIMQRIESLNEIFISDRNNFKTLLIEYHFRKILSTISDIMDDNKDKKDIKIPLSLSSERIRKYSNYNTIKETIYKYIAVWNFKYLSEFSENSDFLKFFVDSEYLELSKYLYNDRNYTSNILLFEKNDEGEIIRILNNIVDYISNIWTAIKSWLF